MRKNRRSPGFTLLEVLIASAILGVVVLMAMNVLFSSSRTASSGQLMSQLEQRASRLQSFCRDQFSQAVFARGTSFPQGNLNLGIVTTSYNTAIGYQIVGQTTAAATGAAPPPTFGYPDPTQPVNATTQAVNTNLACFIRFEADTVYLESSASPLPTQSPNWLSPYPTSLPSFPSIPTSDPSQLIIKTLNMDVNGNGTRTDTFVSGRLMKYIWDEVNGVLVGREKLDDQVILAVNAGALPGQFQGTIQTVSTSSSTMIGLSGMLKSSAPVGAIPNPTPDYLFIFTDANGGIDPGLTGANAAGLIVNVWHGCLDQDGKRFLLRNSRQFIHIRPELQSQE